MRRIVGLISRLTANFDSTLNVREAAARSAGILATEFPATSVLLLRRENEGAVTIIGGVGIEPAWRHALLFVRDLPGLDVAFAQPDRISTSTHRGVPVLAAAIPGTKRPRYAVMLLPDAAMAADAQEFATLATALEITRQLIAASRGLGRIAPWRSAEAIHRAKLEWEHTADALPQIVGLLDWRGHIIRVNRTPERWQLGAVRQVVGRDLHGLLHPTCANSDCELHGKLNDALAELWRLRRSGFEITDDFLGRDLIVALESPDDPPARLRGRPRYETTAVFTVTDVTPLRETERQLTALNRTLEQRVSERTSDLASKNKALREEIARRRKVEQLLTASKLELQKLSDRLVTAQEAERKRISQDIHDSVGQMLSAIKYSLERTQVFIERQDLADAGAVLDSAIDRVRRLVQEVRHISMGVRPALLDHLGAASAVRSLCREWQDVYRAVELRTDIGVADTDIPAHLVTTVFRSVQECLHNVARHAEARTVVVAMQLRSGILEVVVQDDGTGFEVEGAAARGAGCLGLSGLRERAERTGGSFAIRSAPGAGTHVCLEWPTGVGEAARLAGATLN